MPLQCSLACSWRGVSSHLNARNKTRFALALGEFAILFLSMNLASRQAKRPEFAICHKHKTVFDKITMSDIAYTVEVIENG